MNNKKKFQKKKKKKESQSVVKLKILEILAVAA